MFPTLDPLDGYTFHLSLAKIHLQLLVNKYEYLSGYGNSFTYNFKC